VISSPPAKLDGATVLQFADLAAASQPGRTRHVRAGRLLTEFAAVALARYEDQPDVYLFYCDPAWTVMTDTCHDDVANGHRPGGVRVRAADVHYARRIETAGLLPFDQSNTKARARGCPRVPREEHRGTMVSVRTFGQRHPFIERPWSEIDAFLAPIAVEHPEFSYLVDIVRRVLASDAQDELAGTTSMHDILVVPRPIPDPPYEVIAVGAPGSAPRATPWSRTHRAYGGDESQRFDRSPD
jgi:hypothetical protein